jgi:FkbM family methyltransferase
MTTQISLLKQLHEILQFDSLTEIVDIGANPIDGDPPYKALLNSGLCKITGFEPQEEGLARLNQNKGDNETYLPYAVGNGTQQTLNICAYPGWTSTRRPSEPSLQSFPVFKHNAQIIRQVPIDTQRLDDIHEVGRMDFLKIDIQGGELDVFRSATRKLARTAVIQTEVSFVNLYENQPSQGDIDIELRQLGFIPHSFAAIKKCMIAPFELNNDPWIPLNQLLEADLVYVRDFRNPAKLDDDQIRHMCLIAHACYGSFDLALRCLLMLQERKAIAENSGWNYVKLLNTAPAPGATR